ncbi:MAG TPA: SpoIID/LytB domain-containing protein [Cyanobacteria bacterium UBA8803]|nr:SpoIID/LytB domain-containing protein [Cyanobacteria bacterium UBA9273]HBL58168.1 SpoIID/LytB domain-containing protein [Cyanobacteria bacterium UBA8803]
MVRIPEKHPVLNGGMLWSISLVSAALVIPWILAQSLPPRSESVVSSSTPSPQLSPHQEPPLFPHHLAAEQDWHRGLVSQSLSWQGKPATTPSASPSPAAVGKNQTAAPKSSTAKSTPQTQTTKSPQTKKQQSSTSTSQQQAQKSKGTSKSKAKAASAAAQAPILEMRVAIAKDVNSLTVGTSTAAEVVDANGKSIGRLSANQGVDVLPEGPNIRIGKWLTPAGVWLKPTKGGLVFVGNRWYRGDLLLVSQGNSLLAVNYVELEAYLTSVVGSEVYPSWPIDALKAQAIAARSYALVHYIRPAHALYDLGNTQRWQVYKGIESEWNTTTQAVKETSGVFLSYKGGVVESMYAASDDIVTNVFGGRGMSQNGAYNLAQKGYDYKQILNSYYPGTSLAWIDTKNHDTN